MAKTKIEWTEHSWNPITGCTPVSEGCRHCYARVMARRLAGRCGYPEAPHHFDVTLHPDKLDVPLRRKKPTTYFVCSMSDLFHEDVPQRFISNIFEVINQAPQHIFQILTKRPQRMLEYMQWWEKIEGCSFDLENVWLGVSVENQATADERLPLLLQTPAAVRFVSCEPLLESVNLKPYFYGWHSDPRPVEQDPGIDWTIVGGESGPGARPMKPDWARSIRDQCRVAGTPYFFKQHGAWRECARSQETGWKYQLNDNYKTVLFMDDGRVINYDHGHTKVDSRGYLAMECVGKKRADRLLDGREHNELPNTPRTQP